MNKLTPFLWFEGDNAIDVARYYKNIFGSKQAHIHNEESIGNTSSGSVQVVTIDILGLTLQLMSAGKHDSFNDAISFMIQCEDQTEIDHYWNKLSSVPEAEQCGWCRDKYGVRWQIVPNKLNLLIGSEAGMHAMLKMKKIIISDLEKAYKEGNKKTKITIEETISADRNKVWDYYTDPKHIIKWNFASDDWCCPSAENDLRVGGKYKARMEAKDKRFGFDFEAIYDEIVIGNNFTYTMSDDRKVIVSFEEVNNETRVIVVFDAEKENSEDMQRQGWQSILNNFKKHVEGNKDE